MTTFRVGMKVVCVDATSLDSRHLCGDLHGLELGAVYTVRAIGAHYIKHTPGLFLREIIRPIWPGHTQEATFAIWRFRPVAYPKQSAEQDVATFLHIANHIANHIDPIIRADEYRQEMEESEARLERLWTAMRSFEL